MPNFRQKISVQCDVRPIVIIGAGGIVRDAHLPAYQKAGFPVLGLYDIDNNQAKALKKCFPIVKNVFSTLEDAVNIAVKNNAIFDLAVPAKFIYQVIKELPNASTVLIQKPLGETLMEAEKIYKLCKEKSIIASVNFQLKFAPYMLAAKDIISKKLIGQVFDWELKVCVYTPWDNWSFLFGIPRVEILYHSIHYLDLCRNFLGNPNSILASTIKHPKMKQLANTRSTILMDYDADTQARVLTNHGHNYGREHQESYLKIEGTEGAIKIIIGTSLDYPKGVPSKLYYYLNSNKKWMEEDIEGEWFPDAFIGSMSSLQNYSDNKKDADFFNLEDSLNTMKLVEKAYKANNCGGIPFA